MLVIILLFSLLSSNALLSAADPLDNPKLKDPFIGELLAQSEQECGEPEGDGLMFSCDQKNDPLVIVRPGESLQLNCSVSGSRNMAIQWKRNAKTIAVGPSRARRGTPRPFLRTEILQYRIGCVTPKDAGIYLCVAHADSVTIRQKTTVIVLTDDSSDDAAAIARCSTPPTQEAPKIYAYTDTIFDAPKTLARLTCRATGTPAPSITWYKRQIDMTFSKVENKVDGYTIFQNGDMLLPPLSLEPIHFAEYKCEAKNEAGEDSASAYIQVMPSATVEELALVSPVREPSAAMVLGNGPDYEEEELVSLKKRKRNRRHDAIDELFNGGSDDDATQLVRISPSSARRMVNDLLLDRLTRIEADDFEDSQ